MVGWSHILSTVIGRCLAQACGLIGRNKFTLWTYTEPRPGPASLAPGVPVLYICTIVQLLHSYNEETGESDETGEDDKAVDNEVEECVWVPREHKS